ncbi:MAG: hypothetical protein ABI145_19310 [Steroidobacteraceae bacterium]
MEALTTKIGLAVAWAEVYGVKRLLVLKASSGFAKGFLFVGSRIQINQLAAR